MGKRDKRGGSGTNHDRNERNDRYDGGYDSGDDTGYGAGYDDTGYAENRALIARGADDYLPSPHVAQSKEPVIIPGTGVSMGNPFIKRRERPLTMRLAIVTITACIIGTGLFAVTPLGTSAESNLNAFQALSGAVVVTKDVSFHWHTVTAGETIESIASDEHVQIGGIYKLNNLLIGQEITVGKAYKIPDDPFYGKDFRPDSLIVGGAGKTTFGDSPWTSIAGDPLQEAQCGPGADPSAPDAYQLVQPNLGAHWVRGFTSWHNGVDIAAPAGNPIRAAQAGQVIWAGWDFFGLGWSVKINHCHHISTVYGHMIQAPNVKVGDNVEAGAIIGLEGSTGNSTGPHLHFMVEEDNNPVDPLKYYSWSICDILKAC